MPFTFVYALRPFQYNGKEFIVDQVLELRELLQDEVLLQMGYVALLPPGRPGRMSYYWHVPTDRHFFRRQPCDAFRMVSDFILRPGHALARGERITPMHPDFGYLYQNYLEDIFPLMIPEAVYEALGPSHKVSPPLPEAPPVQASGATMGRPPGSGLIYPELEQTTRLLEPEVLKFFAEKGRWPTRLEAINLVEWPDRKLTVDNLQDRFRRGNSSYIRWLTTLPQPKT